MKRDPAVRCVLVSVFTAWLVLAGGRVSAEEGEDKPYPLVIFDINALVKPVKDFPGPRFEMSAGRALETLLREVPGPLPGGVERHRPTVLTAVDLEELVRESDPIWSGAEAGVRLSLVRNRLFVQGPTAAVERLRALLRVLEREAARSFHVRAVIVEVPKNRGPQLLAKPGSLLGAGDAAKRFDALPEKGGKVLADASVSALNGQRVHLADGRERSFIVDYEVMLAKDAAEADPIIEIFRDGIILDVRPMASPSGERVRLDLYVGYSRFEPDTPRFDCGNPRLGPVDLPRVTGFRMESSVNLPVGDFLVLGPLFPSPHVTGSGGGTQDAPPGKGPKEGDKPKGEPVPKGDVYLLLQAKQIAR
ncbi:MAG: hypothetical protein ACYS47_21405 [Planctomycetota bacterium]|jgi:hypothetical protein